jgi:isoamylase
MNDSLIHTTKRKLTSGSGDALGATLSPDGVNFAIYSKYAKEIFLLLFSPGDDSPTDIIKLERSDKDIWQIFVPRIKAGQLYGYKVKGDYNPAQGMRFNEHKLLMDPYGKSFYGDCRNTDDLLFGYNANSPEKDLSFDSRDNASMALKSVVVDDTFDWQSDQKPCIPLEKLIIYEVPIKGFTAHRSSGVKAPGTYSGFIEKIPYLKSLGINAVELLPVHQSYKRDGLIKLGLTDYWGYNSVGFFAPENSYGRAGGAASAVEEFKTLVKELHKAGIEVIMDVVYNHTGEGDEIGPTLCFRGIDNPSYYALRDGWGSPYRFYVNDAGCGNMLNVENPIVRRLVLDSLRYWAEVMHVDGFRFDLASILGRVNGQFSKDSAFFTIFSKDPILKNVKVIAEPWDLTTYQIGNFPRDWSEWNGKFRDNARKFILGYPGQAKELSLRLTGSADLYGDDGRSPYNSINFITCHDGFTLNDLYSYDRKHNEANAENNKDGTNENFSWNCGVEGPTEDAAILRLRKQMIKNALSCLLIPLGTPMILGGDEFMRTQNGNNNAYCQDKEEIWFDWDYAKQHKDMTEFLRKIIVFRKRYTVLQQRKFLAGQGLDFAKVQGIAWYGENLDSVRWDDPALKTFCCHLDGSKEPSSGLGRYYLFFILNADTNGHTIKIPQHENITWYRVLDTSLESGEDILAPGKEKKLADPGTFRVSPRCVAGLLGKPSVE